MTESKAWGIFRLKERKTMQSSPDFFSLKKELKKELLELDILAKSFLDLNCSTIEQTDFCWWFKFNLALGETGSQKIREFAQSVPVYFYPEPGYSVFAGEAHIFQYPAHFLLKGLRANLQLDSGESLAEYVEQTNWQSVFEDASIGLHPQYTNRELSWYWLGRASYSKKKLRQIEANLLQNSPLSCDGAFYLAGLMYYKPEEFKRYAWAFQEKIKKMIADFPEARQFDRRLYQFFLATYLLEGYSLAGKEELVSKETIAYLIKFIRNFRKEFEQRKKNHASAESFIENDPEFAYVSTCILGHLRYGAKVYLGIEKINLSESIFQE